MKNFDELELLAKMKERPGLYFGRPSLTSLRDQLWGMDFAFRLCGRKDELKYFFAFTQWYFDNVVQDQNGYASWHNHMRYVSGGDDAQAFAYFFRRFEHWLKEQHGLTLPEPPWRA